MQSRVVLREMDAERGPAGIICFLEDADEVGIAAYVNSAGECYWTLPYSHWAHALIRPLQTHVDIQRRANAQDVWTTIGSYLVVDHDSTEDDTVFYGDDYLSLFANSLTALETHYTDIEPWEIIRTEAQAAITQNNDTPTVQNPDSRLGFVTVGRIDGVIGGIDNDGIDPITIDTSDQSRLDFMVQVASTLDDRLPQLRVSAEPFEFEFCMHPGVDHPDMALLYGDKVDSFRLRGGYGAMATTTKAVAQALAGVTVLYSTQTPVDTSLYGISEKAVLFNNVPNQASLDRRTAYAAKQAAQLNRDLALSIVSGAMAPFDGYALLDSFPVTIHRGRVDLDSAYYTIWGLEWIGHRNGSETLRPALQPRRDPPARTGS